MQEDIVELPKPKKTKKKQSEQVENELPCRRQTRAASRKVATNKALQLTGSSEELPVGLVELPTGEGEPHAVEVDLTFGNVDQEEEVSTERCDTMKMVVEGEGQGDGRNVVQDNEMQSDDDFEEPQKKKRSKKCASSRTKKASGRKVPASRGRKGAKGRGRSSSCSSTASITCHSLTSVASSVLEEQAGVSKVMTEVDHVQHVVLPEQPVLSAELSFNPEQEETCTADVTTDTQGSEIQPSLESGCARSLSPPDSVGSLPVCKPPVSPSPSTEQPTTSACPPNVDLATSEQDHTGISLPTPLVEDLTPSTSPSEGKPVEGPSVSPHPESSSTTVSSSVVLILSTPLPSNPSFEEGATEEHPLISETVTSVEAVPSYIKTPNKFRASHKKGGFFVDTESQEDSSMEVSNEVTVIDQVTLDLVTSVDEVDSSNKQGQAIQISDPTHLTEVSEVTGGENCPIPRDEQQHSDPTPTSHGMGSQQRKEDLRDGEKVAGLPNQPSGRKEEVLSKFFDSLLQKKVTSAKPPAARSPHTVRTSTRLMTKRGSQTMDLVRQILKNPSSSEEGDPLCKTTSVSSLLQTRSLSNDDDYYTADEKDDTLDTNKVETESPTVEEEGGDAELKTQGEERVSPKKPYQHLLAAWYGKQSKASKQESDSSMKTKKPIATSFFTASMPVVPSAMEGSHAKAKLPPKKATETRVNIASKLAAYKDLKHLTQSKVPESSSGAKSSKVLASFLPQSSSPAKPTHCDKSHEVTKKLEIQEKRAKEIEMRKQKEREERIKKREQREMLVLQRKAEFDEMEKAKKLNILASKEEKIKKTQFLQKKKLEEQEKLKKKLEEQHKAVLSRKKQQEEDHQKKLKAQLEEEKRIAEENEARRLAYEEERLKRKEEERSRKILEGPSTVKDSETHPLGLKLPPPLPLSQTFIKPISVQPNHVAKPVCGSPSKTTFVSPKVSSKPVSYLMTPDVLASMDTYNIDDLNSSDDTDNEDDPAKPIPEWAQSANLAVSVRRQELLHWNIDAIFPPQQLLLPPNLTNIFKRKRPRYHHRTSSANWNTPPKKRHYYV